MKECDFAGRLVYDVPRCVVMLLKPLGNILASGAKVEGLEEFDIDYDD